MFIFFVRKFKKQEQRANELSALFTTRPLLDLLFMHLFQKIHQIIERIRSALLVLHLIPLLALFPGKEYDQILQTVDRTVPDHTLSPEYTGVVDRNQRGLISSLT